MAWDHSGVAGVLRRTAPLTLIALAAVVLAVPASAGAAKRAGATKTVTDSTSISGFGNLGTAEARCPKGTVAIGGGYDAEGLLFVYESRRVRNHTWQVSAGQSGAGPTKLTAFAYCRRATVVQVTETLTLPGTARAEQHPVATCEAGQKVLSGGFHLPPQTGNSVTFAAESTRAGSSSWSVRAVRTSAATGGDNDVIAFAYCAKAKGRGTQERETSSTVTAAATVPVDAVTDPCARPQRPIGGGFTTTLTDQGSDRGAIFVTESRAAGKGWRVSGSATGGTGLPVTLNAFAFCR